MIVVRVDLVSAVTGRTSPLGSMRISNDGTGTRTRGNYNGETLRKGHDPLRLGGHVRSGRVEGYGRVAKPVWDLVADMLSSMGYGGGGRAVGGAVSAPDDTLLREEVEGMLNGVAAAGFYSEGNVDRLCSLLRGNADA